MGEQALIRVVTPSDTQRVTEIYGHYVRQSTATLELEPPDEAEMDRRRDGLAVV